MSDPVTNVEIEDVLSSIRRLVSDGDKARTRDTAPVQDAPEVPQDAAIEPESFDAPKEDTSPSDGKIDKLVLTPAFLVVDGDNGQAAAAPDADEHDADDEHYDLSEDKDAAEDNHEDHDDHSGGDEDDSPLALTEMVWDEGGEDAKDEDDAGSDNEGTDRSDLVATIAELEAAISRDTDDYEPDGSEEVSETIPWPGTIARQFDNVEEAEPADEAADDVDVEEQTVKDEPDEDQSDGSVEAEFHHSGSPDVDITVAQDQGADQDDAEEDLYGDDDLDGLLDVGGLQIDEDALRDLVADVVRQELTGPLGERITRNVRKLVRREIYRILSSQEFD